MRLSVGDTLGVPPLGVVTLLEGPEVSRENLGWVYACYNVVNLLTVVHWPAKAITEGTTHRTWCRRRLETDPTRIGGAFRRRAEWVLVANGCVTRRCRGACNRLGDDTGTTDPPPLGGQVQGITRIEGTTFESGTRTATIIVDAGEGLLRHGGKR